MYKVSKEILEECKNLLIHYTIVVEETGRNDIDLDRINNMINTLVEEYYV